MAKVRFHLVTALGALITSSAGAAIYILLTERRGLHFLGWLVMLLAVCYPSLLTAMRSESQDRCTLWLKRLATGGR